MASSVLGLLPPSGSVNGWKLVKIPHVYTPTSLYELIDGEADAVKSYGFITCADAHYSPDGSGQQSVDINVYDMSKPINAFGLFSHDRQGATPLSIGAGGCQTSDGTGISFWKGEYLVRLAVTTHDATYLGGMKSLAQAVSALIHGSSEPPALLRSLPSGVKPGSESYELSNVAGHEFINNAVTGRYPSAGSSAELFIAEYPSGSEAAGAYTKYLAYEKSNTGLSNLSIGSQAFGVLDRFSRNVVVSQKGRYLVGIVRSDRMADAQGLVKAAVGKLHG